MSNSLTSGWNNDANKNIDAIQTKKNEIQESKNVITKKKNDWGWKVFILDKKKE